MKPLPPALLNPSGGQYPLMTTTDSDEAPVCHSAVITLDPPAKIDFTITSTRITPREAAEQVRIVLGPFRYPAPALWHQARQWSLNEAAWLGAGIDPDFVIPVDQLHHGALTALTPLIAIISAGLSKLIGPTGTPQDYLAAFRTLELPATVFTQEAPTTTHPFGQYPGSPQALVAPMVTLEQAAGCDEQQVATGGRPSTNAEPYAYIDSLMDDNMGLRDACYAATIKFPKGDPKKREASLYTGYMQLRRKRMNEANKPI